MSVALMGNMTFGLMFALLPGTTARAQEEEGFDELEMEMFFAPAETVESAAKHVQPVAESPSAMCRIGPAHFAPTITSAHDSIRPPSDSVVKYM